VAPLGNQSPLKRAVWCKNDGDTPKSVFSRAWQEICNQKNLKINKKTFEHDISPVLGRPYWADFDNFWHE